MLRGAAGRLENTLASLRIEHDVKEYPESGHSFLDDHKSLLFAVMGTLMGAKYNEKDSADARRRIADFFRATSPKRRALLLTCSRNLAG